MTAFRKRVLKLSVINFCVVLLVIITAFFFHRQRAHVPGIGPHSPPFRGLPRQNGDTCSKTHTFLSQCDSEDLFKLRYSNTSGTNVPFPTGGKTTCPRGLETPRFPVPYTGLLTFPGSGNTWTRHLLQELTGLPTGSSSIPDEVLRVNGFPSEGKLEGVIAVQSYGKMNADSINRVPIGHFSRLIAVVRNPFRCFVSEYKRNITNGSRIDNIMIDSGTHHWSQYISKQVWYWQRFIDTICRFHGPVFVIFYEDLQSRLLTELIYLSEFLSTKDLTEFSFCCALKRQEGNFHRPKSNQTMATIFSRYNQARINAFIEWAADRMRPKYPEVSRKLYDYKAIY